MEDDGFAWWIQRIKRALDLYDEFRIDHFRAFSGFWGVPSGVQFINTFILLIVIHEIFHSINGKYLLIHKI